MKKKKDGEMGLGGWGRLFEGGDNFKYFRLRGAIIQGRQLFKGRLLFEEIRYIHKTKKDEARKSKEANKAYK